MLGNVAVLAYAGMAPFELGVLCEAFGVDRTDDGLPAIDFAVCGPTPGPLSTTVPGLSVTVEHGMDRLADADLVAVPSLPRADPPGEVVEALRAARDRGARLLSVCTGAFVLGAAGLLDDRECTTHWMHTAELAERFPRARVVPEVLYVDAGQVVTSAGTAAGLDACLHVWRQELGSAVAGVVARRMVVPPQREGGQAQFIARAVPECTAETLGPLLAWVAENLAADLGVEELARRAHMSPRTFARRFRDETGTTPHAWVTAQRVRLAEELLERTDLAVERIAAEVGFVNAATLRHHFTRARGVSPQRYRRTFACSEEERAATG
ncbi:GlxA family transcriptional regulator [Nocardioides sp. CPCC 205120]|uniref:GlxA family transcriptional regulator n=1 Tax=Nocardioides sp. CPCC 205120 TaxID=3406462 RepID=UPI003B50D115